MLIAGVDEAGRGALCGAVVAAAVILDPKQPIAGLNDSKKISAQKRETLYRQIISQSLAYGIGIADVKEIDERNILQASLLAMQRAVKQLVVQPQQILVDGNQIFTSDIPIKAIIGGDATIAAISAASILAKVTRDKMMLELDKKYPDYQLARHKGYGTKLHLQALQQFGASAIHRISFAPVKRVLTKI